MLFANEVTQRYRPYLSNHLQHLAKSVVNGSGETTYFRYRDLLLKFPTFRPPADVLKLIKIPPTIIC